MLPDAPCPPGQMAVPGDTRCHEVMACGPGPWGDIPVDASTIYVDAAFAGASDGSDSAPWTTISEAVSTAPAGSLVAIAAGTYVEDVTVDTPLRLHGVCPALVELVGTPAGLAALFIRPGASQSEVRGIALGGATIGVFLSGAQDVVLDRLWIHDTIDRGVDAEIGLGPVSFTLRDSLVEGSGQFGVYLSGAQATIEGTVVRDTQPDGAGDFGRGLNLRDASSNGEPARLTLQRSLVERNVEDGIFVQGSEATLQACVVRDTQPNAGVLGRGINVRGDASGAPSRLTVRQSLVESNRETGIFVAGSEAIVEASIVRDTAADTDSRLGRGLQIQPDPNVPARPVATVRRSVFEGNHDTGVAASSAEALIESVVARATRVPPNGATGSGIAIVRSGADGEATVSVIRGSVSEDNDGFGVYVVANEALIETTSIRRNHSVPIVEFGAGLGVQEELASGTPANVTVRTSVVEHNFNNGVIISGATGVLESTAVIDTQPSLAGEHGRGIHVQRSPLVEGSFFSITQSSVERNRGFGILFFGMDGTIERTRVADTSPVSDGRYGDGVTAAYDQFELVPRELHIDDSAIENSARAGVSNFGSRVTLRGVTVRCAAFELEGEAVAGVDFAYEDRGANACGCPTADATCRVVSVGLAPPEAVD